MIVLLIIPFRGFQDIEFTKTKEVLENAGVGLELASAQKGVAQGAFGACAKVGKIVEEVNVEEYDAVVFIGGPGTPSIRRKSDSLRIAKEAFEKGKIVGAICCAPTILAKAGILKNKKVTVWVGPDEEYGKTTDKVLEQYGADYVPKAVVVDGNIVTADGPSSAEKFANEILKLLKTKM